MKYMGSKSRIKKEIQPIIQKYIDDNKIDTYISVFFGGGNADDEIICKTKIANDINWYLIELYRNLDKINELPEFVTKEHYSEVREEYNKVKSIKNLDCDSTVTRKFEDWYIGAIGFLASYNGRFFDGGYAGIVKTKANTERNYYDEAKRNLTAQIPLLKDFVFECADYTYFSGYKNCVLYCDPPYKDTKQYNTSKNFNHDKFWQWVRDMSKDNIVIVSEQQAPEDFKCIWEQGVTRSIDNNKRVKSVEKLFVYGGNNETN